MKAKYFIIGCLMVCLCIPQCKKEKDTNIKEITISLSSNEPLNINGTVEVTAVITPADAIEGIEWIINSGDNKITITPVAGTDGKRATITAKAAGEAKIQARSASKKAISNEVTVTVDSEVDFAALLAGKSFVGTAETDGQLKDPIENVGVSFEKKNTVIVTVTVVAYLPGFGENSVIGELQISESGTPGVYNLIGTGAMDLSYVAPDFGILFDITGTYTDTEPKKLILNMIHTADSPVEQDIYLTAYPGSRVPDLGPAAEVAGTYTTTAKMSGVEIEDVKVVLERVDNDNVTMTITGDFGDLGESIVGNLKVSASFGLTGTVTAGETKFNVTGVVDTENSEISLTLNEKDGDITILIPSPGPDPDYASDVVGTYYGEGKCWTSGDVKDVVITLTRINNTTVSASIALTLPTAINMFSGTYTTSMTVTPDYDLTDGLVKWMTIFPFDVVGTVDPENHTITMNMVGDISDGTQSTHLNIVLTGGSDAPAPAITIGTQPLDVAVKEGSITESLKVAASVTQGGTPTYQWYENATNSIDGGTEITGATNATFAIPTTLTEAGGPDYFYYCVVSAEGATSVTSKVAKVTVSFEPDDYASDVVGTYYGLGNVTSPVPADITDVEIALVHVNNTTVAATIKAVLPVAFGGSQTMSGNLTVSSTNELSGTVGEAPLTFTVTGQVNPTDKTIELNLVSAVATLKLTGGPDKPEPPDPDYAADVVGTYYGLGNVTSPVPADITDVEIALVYVNNTKAAATIKAVLPVAFGGSQTMSGNLTVSSTNELSGTVGEAPLTFTVTGQVNPTNKTIELNLVSAVATLKLTGGPDKPEPPDPDYAADVVGTYYGLGNVTSPVPADITDVEIALVHVNNTTVAATIKAVLPVAFGGSQTMSGNLTVSSTNELSGTVGEAPLTFTVTGQVNPTNKTIELNLVSAVATLKLTGEME